MNLGEAIFLIMLATLMAIFWDFFGMLNAIIFGLFGIAVMCLFELIQIRKTLEYENRKESEAGLQNNDC